MPNPATAISHGLLFACLALTSIARAAGTNPMNEFATTNALLEPARLPYELPPFDRIRDTDYLPAFEAGMQAQRAEIRGIADNSAPPTFENTVVALERSGQLLERVASVFGNLNASNTDPRMQQIDSEMAPKLQAQ